MIRGMYILRPSVFETIYAPAEREHIADQVNIADRPFSPEEAKNHPGELAEIEVMFSGWGGPKIDEDFLALSPKLKMVFYGAGSIRGIVSDAFWNRNVRITSAVAANAVPVAEYTLSQVLFALKRGWAHQAAIRQQGQEGWKQLPAPGGYGSTVGIIGLGQIGRLMCNHLARFDVQLLVFDPYATEEDARKLGVTLVDLETLFAQSDVVTLHAPNLPETRGMITGKLLGSMKNGATFINTARGAIVRETELIEVFRRRKDLWAILDVTDPEPPEEQSALYELPNVVLTPHIAGSMSNECRRMGRYMAEELDRYLADKPLHWEITREQANRMA